MSWRSTHWTAWDSAFTFQTAGIYSSLFRFSFLSKLFPKWFLWFFFSIFWRPDFEFIEKFPWAWLFFWNINLIFWDFKFLYHIQRFLGYSLCIYYWPNFFKTKYRQTQRLSNLGACSIDRLIEMIKGVRYSFAEWPKQRKIYISHFGRGSFELSKLSVHIGSKGLLISLPPLVRQLLRGRKQCCVHF